MSPINLPRNNRYLPRDMRGLLPSMLNESDFEDFNFSYLFNLPLIFFKGREMKICINEEIEKFKWDKEWIKHINERIFHFVKQLEKYGFSKSGVQSTLSWRMVIGLGASHPQETSMTLHHIYGIPYIPGSAIKGVARHQVTLKFFEEAKCEKWEEISCFGKVLNTSTEKDFKELSFEKFQEKFQEKKAKPSKTLFAFCKFNFTKINEFQKIFGTQENQGNIIFLDAYPVDKINLKIDVMTPHYPDYYSKGIEPADWQSPNPIKFLTVEKTAFQFYLACRKENEALLEKALRWLKESLSHFGIGAKTSIGYGYFDIR